MTHTNFKFIIPLLLLMLISCFEKLSAQGTPVVKNLSPKEIEKRWKAQGGLLLDVRTAQEWNEDGYIPGAVRIDAYSKDLETKVGEKASDKKKPIFVYCAAGGRSARVAQRLIQQGYTQVYNMSGGIYQWAADGLPLKNN